jgi:uncharacterized protein (TIGR02145 family)
VKDSVPANGDSLTVRLYASYKDNNKDTKYAYLEIRVEDGTCICPAKISDTQWLNFMCHNLGALDIISPSQLITREHHGDWYRFGAKQTSMKNTSAHDADNSWDNPNYYTLSGNWPADSIPCPAGWRLPDIDELSAVINKNMNNANISKINPLSDVPDPWKPFSGNQTFSNLKKSGDYLYLPTAGSRYRTSYDLRDRGIYGFYWSSSTGSSSGFGYNIEVTSTPNTLRVNHINRDFGYSVRCVEAE